MPAPMLMIACFFTMIASFALFLGSSLESTKTERGLQDCLWHKNASIAMGWLFMFCTLWLTFTSGAPTDTYKVKSFMHEGKDYIILKGEEWINLNETLKKDVETGTVFLVKDQGMYGGVDYGSVRSYTEYNEEEEKKEIPFFEGKRD